MASRTLGQGKSSTSVAYIPPNFTASNWTATTVTSGYTQPSAGSNVTISFSQTGWMVPGMLLYISNGGLVQVVSIASSTSTTVTNLAGYSNPTGSITSGGSVRPALIYPVTVTQPSGLVNGMTILEQISQPGNQKTLQAGGGANGQFSVWPLGNYPNAIGNDMRVYNQVGGSHAAVNGTQNPPCLELPDGVTNQGSKIWSGSGPPSALTVGAATAGDYYLCRSSVQCVAMSYITGTTAGLSVGSGTLTNGTALLRGAVEVGDLLVLVYGTSSATARTLTVNDGSGGTSGITPTATDGGATPTSAAGARLYIYSHVVQAGEISAGQTQTTLSATNNPTMHAAYVFRHPNGWPTTGSLFGCPMAGTYASTETSSGATPITLTVTGTITLPTVSVASILSDLSNAVFLWNGSLFTDGQTADYAATAGAVSAKPGLGGSFFGGNNSGGSCLPAGEASCYFSGLANSAKTAAVTSWSPNSTPSGTLNPSLYVCTSGGSPGTWTQVI